ncbi:tRNA (adenosine(37)-N6)-threonylcarbamoyltransferase complex dimerization subunit type 1 TsaB [Azospirillum sp. B506]|uniref:tRNA (adenosine(37)-N6)-threonylcarbamoyltransferase complex dimerization subunit type 1 TsaB n=1 Tax=Azospirillum sp. B506 TaxID=137721 RepID=UPI0006795F12|nr:tRNA (adenosine(37)-N6)-threonylcarbamoyltransferase complex dimerization subunit type 1 TsaB [Azospirillum sp. B506]
MLPTPLILTVDTTSEQFGVALSRGGAMLDCRIGKSSRTLDVDLFAHVRSLLDRNGLSLADVEGLAACVGPGSFVGTRIGLCAVNTFSIVRDIRAIGVGVLPALATLAPDNGEGKEILAAVNCVRNEYFFQTFAGGIAPRPLGPIAVARSSELEEIADGRIVVARSFAMNFNRTGQKADPPPGIEPEYKDQLRAIVALAAGRWETGGDSDGTLPAPIYVKSEVARS